MVLGSRFEVRDMKDISYLRSGTAIHIPTKVNRRFLQIRPLIGQVAEIL
jgi:hypothetical protein